MYDVIVIGGGSGGYAAAIRASQLGGKVAVVEAGEIGGTCVNRGCIPTKIWLRAASMLYWLKRAEEFGIKAPIQEVELKTVVERKDGIAGDIRAGMESLLANNKVEIIRGEGVVKSPRGVSVNGKTFETKKIIIATGSSLSIPAITGLEDAALTTDQVLEANEAPSSVLIWGNIGPIEVEMATLLNILGTKVVVASETRRILPKEDGDTSQRIAQALRDQGVEIHPRSRLEEVRGKNKRFVATLSGVQEREIEVERVLVSARRPNTFHLGLESLGMRFNEDGGIRVNERLETSIPEIYAIGDVTGGWMLSHAASSMAIVAAENAMGGSRRFPFNLVPRGIWSIPEVGAVGLSEEEAERMGMDIEVGDFPYSINGLALARDEMSGAVKVISSARYGEILGVHIVGANATELVGEAVLAMQLEARVAELARSIRVHPTFSESVVDAARDAQKWALYLPRQ